MDPQTTPQNSPSQTPSITAVPAGDPFAPQGNYNPTPYVPPAASASDPSQMAAPQPQAQPLVMPPSPMAPPTPSQAYAPSPYAPPMPAMPPAAPAPQPIIGDPYPAALASAVAPAAAMPSTLLAQPLDPKQQIGERLKGSVNVLVTVSNNPTVDQLSAAIGLTLLLNKLKKHGTAVFSGQVPSAIDFLEPEKTLEKNTDSLQDFIIALDKSKADKLRYKIEDTYVKIFITPYHTSLSEKDLEFGQGDLNVDVIIALGVSRREELDQAVVAHGRILHDATVVSITREPGDDIGTINWHMPEASSFSEIVVTLAESLKSPQTEIFDAQIATALLTGIVAETDRFSNEKTTPQTMTTSAILMRAGANQQLIATKLEEPEPIPEETHIPQSASSSLAEASTVPVSDWGSPVTPASQPAAQAPAPVAEPTPLPPAEPMPAINPDGSMNIPHDGSDEEKPADPIHIDENGMLHKLDVPAVTQPDQPAAAAQAPAEPSADALSLPPIGGVDTANKTLDELEKAVNREDQTLEQIERAVNSPHLAETSHPDPLMPAQSTDDEVRPYDDQHPKPIVALNALPLELDTGHEDISVLPTPGIVSEPQSATPTPPSSPPPLTPPAS